VMVDVDELLHALRGADVIEQKRLVRAALCEAWGEGFESGGIESKRYKGEPERNPYVQDAPASVVGSLR